MKLGSLFSGAGGFEYAGTLAGMVPVWASEIEPFPIRVTTKRFPDMKHLGNIKDINGAEIEPIDVITFGSPCQDLSIAGKRQGIMLDGGRSNLFFEAIRIIKEMRYATNGEYPKFAVWENVKGAFSSNKGEDFKAVLEQFASIKGGEGISIPMPTDGRWRKAGEIVGDGYSIAWRTYDAQFWGVPQRRERIYLVADFTGECAGKVQFESDRLFGDIEKGKCEGEDITRFIENGARKSGEQSCIGVDVYHWALTGDVAATLTSNSGSSGTHSGPSVLAFHLTQYPIAFAEKTPCISAGSSDHGEATVGVVQFAPVYCIQGNSIDRTDTSGCNGKGWQENNSFTLNTVDRHAVAYQKVYGSHNKDARYNEFGDKSETLCAYYGTGGNQPIIVENDPYSIGNGQVHDLSLNDKAKTLNCMHDAQAMIVPQENSEFPYIARRLTPLECARLQGFPDWWCDGLPTENPTEQEIDWWADVFETQRKAIDPKKKPKTRNQIKKWLQNPQTDSAEYKMWGNSLAIPCAYQVLAGIAEVLKDETNEGFVK